MSPQILERTYSISSHVLMQLGASLGAQPLASRGKSPKSTSTQLQAFCYKTYDGLG